MKSDPVFNPENQSTIARLLAAREAAQSASATVKTARREVSQASKDLAAEAIRKAQARHAGTASKPTATTAELLALPDAKAKLLNSAACYGNKADLDRIVSAYRSATDHKARVALHRRFKGALAKAGIR